MSSKINGPVTVKLCGGYAAVFLDADDNVIQNDVILPILNRDDLFGKLVEALKDLASITEEDVEVSWSLEHIQEIVRRSSKARTLLTDLEAAEEVGK